MKSMFNIILAVIFLASIFTVTDANAQRRTSLVPANSNAVNWSDGDAFSMLSYTASANTKDVLVVKLTAASSGIGISTGQSSSTVCYIKYDGIKVTKADGTDITSTITTAGTSGNSYKIGGYTGSGTTSDYAYVPAGTSLQLTANTSTQTTYTVPFVQASSSSDVATTNIYVQIKGLQWSLDNSSWTSITSSSTLVNGFGGKYAVNYTWNSSIVDDPTTLTYSTSYTPDESETSSVSNLHYTLASGSGSSTATFSGDALTDGTTYYGVYPYSTSNSFDGTNITFTLPSTQTYTSGSFYNNLNPQAGVYSTTNGIAFKNLCGIFCLQLTGTETVTSISLKDNANANLCGTATVAATTLGTDNAVASVTNGSSTVTLNCPDGVTLSSTPTPFYFILPVHTLTKGFTATVTTNEGVSTLTTDKAQTIKRSVIKKMTACALPEITIEELNVENPAVDEYLANATVTFSSTTDSNYDSSFFDTSRSYRPDQPNTKTISFANASSATVTVTMATDASYTNTVLNTTTTGTSYTLRNFIPGNTYFYKVTNGDNLITSGALKVTGQVRMIAIDKGFNIRDLGGWTGLDNKTIRYGQIYRGGSLGGTDKDGNTSDITDEDRVELNRLGIRAQLDLRAATNEGLYKDESSLHSYARTTTTLLDADFNNTMTDNGAYNNDASIVSDVAWIIYELKQGKPVYFNCRQGADRTGTLAFVIEGLLGCYGSDTGHQMALDYELTGFSQANLIDNVSVSTSYRGAATAYGTTAKLFRQLIDLSVSGMTFSNLQEKCYYYLNQYWSSAETCIDKDDLDWFIKYMLNLSSYSHPTWAAEGGDLKTVAEKNANYTTPELNVENKTVQDMMANSYSTFTSGSSSYLDNSTFTSNRSSALTGAIPYRNDQPNTRTIYFTNSDAATVTVTMATDADYENTVLNTTTTASSYLLRNFIPGNTYYYKVTDSSNDVLTSGAFRATGQLRMIKIDDSWNLRDLGGWTGWNGNKVLYEHIYRGGSLGGTNGNTTGTYEYIISDESKAELYRIGLRAHLDLRATSGKGAWTTTGGNLNGFTLGYTPLIDADFQNICTDWALYYGTGSSAAVGDLAFIIKEIEAGKPVYFHCRTGADRTGVVGMTILGLLGCDAYTGGNNGNQIAMDYEFTSLNMDETGTINYNNSNGTIYPTDWSNLNRYANGIQSSGYNYFRKVYGLSSGVSGITLSTFQDRCYYYLNRYFYDHSVSAAGAVYINKTDLDKFINIMLGITDKDGNLINGHSESDKFTGPSWALDYDNNTLDTAISTAKDNEYNYTSN